MPRCKSRTRVTVSSHGKTKVVEKRTRKGLGEGGREDVRPVVCAKQLKVQCGLYKQGITPSFCHLLPSPCQKIPGYVLKNRIDSRLRRGIT